jgi:phage baseplate assembly protein gpV
MRNRTPTISNARVIAVDVPQRRLTVTLPSGQLVSVRMGIHGPADGLRVKHDAMPGRGTEGVVLFPGGDNRNGIWICSIYAQQMDALTTSTDQFLEYNSHWSGHFHLLDGQGNFTESFADGTFLQIGTTTAPPATYRNVVNAQQQRTATEITAAERVPNPPTPFNLTLRHATGTVVSIDPSGNPSITGAAGTAMTFTFGSTKMVIDANGVHITGELDATGNVTAGRGTGDQVDMQNHDHQVVGVEGGDATIITTKPVAGS